MDNEEVMEYEEVTEQEEVPQAQDPIFVCNTAIDANAQMEASKAAMGKSGLIASLIMFGICGIAEGYLILESIRNDHWQKNAFMIILIAAVALFTFFTRNGAMKKATAKWEESITKKYGSPALHVNTEFYELSLAQTLRENEEQFVCDGYSSITEMVETEHLFLLRHAKNQFYFVAKDGFTRGTSEEFRSFILERIGGK